jgi:hypothetical protein
MRTITVEIPDWAEKRHIYVFAGIELLAYQLVGQSMRIKTSRCNMCGKCCIIRGQPCEHLVADGKKRVCDLGVSRPFSCSIGRGASRASECTEQFEDAP